MKAALFHHWDWQNSPFWAMAFPIRFFQMCLLNYTILLLPLDFATILLQNNVVKLQVQPPNLQDQIHVFAPQWQGSPVIPSDTDFPVLHLLWLWGYSGGIVTCLRTETLFPVKVIDFLHKTAVVLYGVWTKVQNYSQIMPSQAKNELEKQVQMELVLKHWWTEKHIYCCYCWFVKCRYF
jgi:hypothetical protein